MSECIIRRKLLALGLDTEGCITARIFRKANPNYLQFEPSVLLFSNNSIELFQFIQNLASEEFPDIKLSVQHLGKTHRLRVIGMKKSKRVLKILLPDLIRTKEDADKVLLLSQKRRFGKRFNQEEIDIILSMRKRPLKPHILRYLKERGFKVD